MRQDRALHREGESSKSEGSGSGELHPTSCEQQRPHFSPNHIPAMHEREGYPVLSALELLRTWQRLTQSQHQTEIAHESVARGDSSYPGVGLLVTESAEPGRPFENESPHPTVSSSKLGPPTYTPSTKLACMCPQPLCQHLRR
eukprot:1829896-Rhodomonas_salina.2